MGYVVLLARGLHTIDRDVRAGGWLKIEGSTLSDATLAVVGFGSIGRAVARRAAAFGMTVEAFDPLPTSRADMSMLGVRPMELDALFERADYVVLCCPLTPETYHLVDRRRLALMRSTARLVNVARGPLVDEAALVEALRGGRLRGAALDVFEVEPLPLSSPLREFDSVILGSHNGSNTAEGVRRTSRLAFDNLIAGLKAKTS
jgi:D-3-phosphoglycerate dehydrogenase